MSNKSDYTLCLSYILITSILFNIYNNIEQIEKYMDEEFHLDQTLSYYNNKFKYWNNKLTTFPGTFFISSIFLKLFYLLKIPVNPNNSIIIVRMFTLVISTFSFILLGLFKKKNIPENSFVSKLRLLIGFFPIYFFYNFLYYTEAFSIFSLIFFFYLNLYVQKNYILIFLSGLFCVSIRQNNIIWVNFFILTDSISLIPKIFNNKSLKKLLETIISIIIKNIDILIIDILFIIFFIYNNFSIVIGDKSHHTIVFHLSQFNHLLIFGLLLFPTLNMKVFRNLNKIINSKKKAASFMLIFILALALILICNRFIYIHDFILSDNRHYIFYYFKKIFLKDNLKYALLIYTSLTYSIIINDNLTLLKDNKIISWFICSLICLVPAKLVEIRYFIPCYIIFIILINYNKEEYKDLSQNIFHWFNIFIHLIINSTSIYIFVFKAFENKYMNNEKSRFMY